MSSIEAILTKKNSQPVILSESSTVAAAIETMYRNQVGSIIVQDISNRPIGILTEKDIIRLYATGHNHFTSMLLKEYMTTEITVVRPSDSISTVLAIMTVKRLRHMPVVDGSKMIGIISIGDLVKAQLEDVAQEAQVLREYITS